MLGEPLKQIRMTEERVQWVRDALRKSSEQEKRFREAELEKLKDEHAELERKIDRMYEDRLSGTVSPEFWRRKYAEYWDRKEMVGVRIKAYEGAHDNYLSEGLRILELAQESYSLYVRRDSFEQRKLLDMILSNCQLKDGKVVAEFRNFFQTLADGVAEEETLAAKNVRSRPEIRTGSPNRPELEHSELSHKDARTFQYSNSSRWPARDLVPDSAHRPGRQQYFCRRRLDRTEG